MRQCLLIRNPYLMKADPSVLINILLLGESAVGKTQLIQQFSAQSFSDPYVNTIGVDCVLYT